MRTDDLVAEEAVQGERLAAAVGEGAVDARVPTCPGWTVRDLARHVGLVHLWAAGHVAHPHEEPDRAITLDDVAPHWPELASAWGTTRTSPSGTSKPIARW